MKFNVRAVLLLVAGLGMLCTVHAAQKVTFRETTITLPWLTSMLPGEAPYGIEPHWWAIPTEVRQDGVRNLKGIWMENEYLAVLVLPEVGGAIGQAIYKPTGDEMFYWEGRVKDFYPYWDSGIKMLFPSSGHAIVTHGQGASYRTFQRQDGTAGVAMWMEFSRFITCPVQGLGDRFSNLMVSTIISLTPGRAELDVTYRIVNPAPYRQGRKIWTGAYFPRVHTPDGVFHGDARPPAPTATEVILPTVYVSAARGSEFRDYDPAASAIAMHPSQDNVWNAWGIPYGFAGLWYPEVKVNRLRITDAESTPGTRFYFRGEGTYSPGCPRSTHIHNFIEIFGSFDTDAHGVENWIEPGQVEEMKHIYRMVYGIGKVSYADANATLSLSLQDAIVDVVTPARVNRLEATWNGEPVGQPQPCAPEQPARFHLPPEQESGRLVLKADGATLLEQEFPLPMPDDTSRHEHIRTSYSPRTEDTQEYFDATERFGSRGSGGYMTLLRRAPAGSLTLGRVQYRAGLLNEALATLRQITTAEPGNGEAWHLTGMSLLEQGHEGQARDALAKALTAEEPYEPARYFIALADVRAGNTSVAVETLSRLIEHDPKHWEARLLKEWLRSDSDETRGDALAALLRMGDEDPADPRVQLAIARGADLIGNEQLSTHAAENLRLLALEPGAWRRIREFNAATRGIYAPPLRREVPEGMKLMIRGKR